MKTPRIAWKRRAKVRHTDTATLRRYEADGAPYAVVEVRSRYGLPRLWLAVRRTEAGEYAIGRHRTRTGAEDRCTQDARKPR